jgi:hypothetical protein
MSQAENVLAMAEGHVREGEMRIARQAALVARLITRRLDPAEAERILTGLQTALALARQHLQLEREKCGLRP